MNNKKLEPVVLKQNKTINNKTIEKKENKPINSKWLMLLKNNTNNLDDDVCIEEQQTLSKKPVDITTSFVQFNIEREKRLFNRKQYDFIYNKTKEDNDAMMIYLENENRMMHDENYNENYEENNNHYQETNVYY